MPDPVAISTAVKTSVGSGGGAAGAGRDAGTSKFRDVQAKVRQRTQDAVDLPPEVKGVPAAERRKIAAAPKPAAALRPEMRKIQGNLQDVSKKVAALPKTPAFDGVRSRLTSIEARYKESTRMIGSLTSVNDPRQLLKVQFGMYELTQNLEIISKVVDGVNSGVKTLLQTQL